MLYFATFSWLTTPTKHTLPIRRGMLFQKIFILSILYLKHHIGSNKVTSAERIKGNRSYGTEF